MADAADTTRVFKATLRKTFPKARFSVTRGGERIEWTDEGPTQTEVEDVLITTGLVEVRLNFRDERYLHLSTGSIYLDRYNVAEREAQKEEFERRLVANQELNRHIAAVISTAAAAKKSAIEPPPDHAPPPISDRTVFDAFEKLRHRAESEASIQDDAERRPSWAPPMILGEELGSICYQLGYLDGDDKCIGRLWAMFATPKRSGTWLREHTSSHPLIGLVCRGFQLHIGSARGPLANMLFEAQRQESGAWRFGPPTSRFFDYVSPRRRDWERLISQRERAPMDYDAEQASNYIAEITRKILAIDAEDLAAAKAYRDDQQMRARAHELARTRVVDFVGAPDAQMQLAARLCGHCCCCFRALTDPISLEHGIGPDCLARRVEFIRLNAGKPLDWISLHAGMSQEFCTEILNEVRHDP